jgi:3-deoxy-manno-octulosonate cytidylyltransferase (CMP-KDO synthetase)
MIVGIIPARYASTRLPGKPLVDLNGRAMIERVWRAATASAALDRVIIATDDDRVASAAHDFGAEVCMTSPELPSGSDRCDAAIRTMHLRPEIVVNIQGDEPLLQPSLITTLVDALRTSRADVSTPVTRILFADELDDPSVVKVARAADGHAVYFSRTAIPFQRDVDKGQWLTSRPYWKHIGLYAFRLSALQRHVALPASSLERAEALEQLRLLEDGARFLCVETDHVLLSVDTPEDADRVRRYLSDAGMP